MAGFGPLGVAVLYPEELRTASGSTERALVDSDLTVQFHAIGKQPGPWHHVQGVDGLVSMLDQARGALVSEDELARSVAMLASSVSLLARGLVSCLRGSC